jgi:WhiB family redox-sensing transcriptional regulator
MLMTPGDDLHGELFALLTIRPAWQAQAACRAAGTDDYFPSRGESTTAAKAVCDGCSVRQECLDYALSTPELLPGIWGGTTAQQRRKMRPAVAERDPMLCIRGHAKTPENRIPGSRGRTACGVCRRELRAQRSA